MMPLHSSQTHLFNVLRLGINYIILGKQSESYRWLLNGVMLAILLLA